MPPSPPPSPKRFRIALSFAGERRLYVAEMAALLAEHFGKEAILYDKFHQAEFAHPDLAMTLPKLYRDDSDLIVPIFCPDYEHKEWCHLEWRAIFSIIKSRNSRDPRQIMPLRFDHAEVDDLHGLSGFIELDEETPQKVAWLILERLALNEGKPKDHYFRVKPAPSAVVTEPLSTEVPHNLPSLQPFFGREKELKIIADALDPDSRIWGAIIDGPGGMGKTSLAVRAAYDARPEDFKRIIFLSLKTRELDDDGERDLSGFILTGLQELYDELARELGRIEIPKALEEQRPRMLLDALQDTRTLLVLDNLENLTRGSRGTILTFVKKLPLGCKAILTSRGRIGSGAEELILGQLSQETALRTLAELARHSPPLAKTSQEERIALHVHTGGNPLLLRWCAGQLGRGHCHTIQDTIAYLCSCPEGNDALKFIFRDLVDDFSTEEMAALSALTYFTRPAKVAHVAILAGLEEAESLKALKHLANRSLVLPGEEFREFSIIPLAADFLCEYRPEAVKETGDRLEKRAYAAILENGSLQHDRFPLLDAGWDWIALALELFLRGPGDALQKVCDALAEFLEFTGRWEEWKALLTEAETRAVDSGDEFKAGWRAYELGFLHALRKQTVEVLDCADRALAHWKKAGDPPRERAAAIRLRGHAYQIREDHVAAVRAHSEAVALDRASSARPEDLANGLSSLAGAERLAGHFDAAERHHLEAMAIGEKQGDREMVAISWVNLAALGIDRGDWSAGEVAARRALPLVAELGRQELIGGANHRLGVALQKQGRIAEALPHLRHALEIYITLGHPDRGEVLEILRECGEGDTE